MAIYEINKYVAKSFPPIAGDLTSPERRPTMTIREACELWVSRDMNAIPKSVLVKLQQLDPEDIAEITPITKGDRVYSYTFDESGEVVGLDSDGETATVELDNGIVAPCDLDQLERQDYARFPMWSTMWNFSCSFDEDWALSHLEEMAACGFAFTKRGLRPCVRH